MAYLDGTRHAHKLPSVVRDNVFATDLAKDAPVVRADHAPDAQHDEREHDKEREHGHAVADDADAKQVGQREHDRDRSFHEVLLHGRPDRAPRVRERRDCERWVDRIVDHARDPGPVTGLERPERTKGVEDPDRVAAVFWECRAQLGRDERYRDAPDDREHQETDETHDRTAG